MTTLQGANVGHDWPPLARADRARFAGWIGGLVFLTVLVAGAGWWCILAGGGGAAAAWYGSRWL